MRRFRAIVSSGQSDSDSSEDFRQIGLDARAWVAETDSWSIEEIEPIGAVVMPFFIFGTREAITLEAYTFKHFMEAIALAIVWMASFRYQRLMIDCIKNLSTSSPEAIHDFPTLDQALNRLADTTSRLAGIVPFLFGKLPSQGQAYLRDHRTGRGSFAGCLFITSICILIYGTRELASYTPALQQWAKGTLLEMSTLYGNKQAQAFHDAYNDIPRDVSGHHFSPWAPKFRPSSIQPISTP